MENYEYKEGKFIIRNFDKQKTFSSFLPGIAGKKGIPIWSFYCNRGQGISSFGTENKDNPILEFFPANTAYQYINTYGFRSFIKVNNCVYEVFGLNKNDDNIERNMYIEYSNFKIEEVNKTLGFKYSITYFIIPNENFGALARKVEIENISSRVLDFELLDGLSTILPYGVTNSEYKEMSNLMRSWFDVYNLENDLPFFTMRASTGDSSEIKKITSGNFYFSFNQNRNPLKVIIDADLVFDYDTSMSYPFGFEKRNINELLGEKQVKVNKVPCAFSVAEVKLELNQEYVVNTIIGKSDDLNTLNEYKGKFLSENYFNKKFEKSVDIIDDILKNVKTETSSGVFNDYIKQCYLDNLLRGGYPIVFGKGENKKIHYIYSRKHGDPERDYNFFNISPEFYSQGNGNFRDVNQNRRNDILFNPEIREVNINLFYSLIQLDGYNPLEVKGYTYSILNENLEGLIEKYEFVDKEFVTLFSDRFTLGEVSKLLTKKNIKDEENFLVDLIGNFSKQNIEASFGEGYWIDHFTYNQDLLDNYLLVYPEEEENLLFNNNIMTYESAEIVLPRKERYVVVEEKIRQYNSLKLDKERVKKLGLNVKGSNWLKNSSGEIYYTSLFNKLVTLSVLKFLNLDPQGVGIEMEANKPGWNDAMNGLPALIGSSFSETIELRRILVYVKNVLDKYPREYKFISELAKLLKDMNKLFKENLNDLEFWKYSNDLKEEYRETIRLGIGFDESFISQEDLSDIVEKMLEKIDLAINKAIDIGEGIIPTFLTYDVLEYNESEEGIKILKVEQYKLPNFLEGSARYLKTKNKSEDLQILYKNVKNTDLFDKKLNMYKTSDTIENCSNDMGRIRAFTAGWQERESIFLHMTYKYMLGLLKSGLYKEFFEDIKTNFVCFREPNQYGRNIIENSSFLVSSVNPNENLHGQGLVARLSGSTAEMLTMWNLMMVGKEWFSYDNELSFKLSPIIPDYLFNNGELSFTLFSTINVRYIKENVKNTYDDGVEVYKYKVDGVDINSTIIKGDIAEKIRKKDVKEIIAYIK